MSFFSARDTSWSIGSLVIFALAIAPAGCSSGGGIFQPPKSSGVIIAKLVGSSTPLATTMSSPQVEQNGFSVVLSEDNYSASFSALVVSFTAPTTESCYVITMDSTGTIATITPRNAPGLGPSAPASTSPTPSSSPTPNPSPSTSPSPSPSPLPGGPCFSVTDVEGIRFSDQQNHQNIQYFENVPVPTPTP